MTRELARASAFLDGLARVTNWVELWDRNGLLALDLGPLLGYALAGLAQSCMAGGASQALPQSGFRAAGFAPKGSIRPPKDRSALHRPPGRERKLAEIKPLEASGRQDVSNSVARNRKEWPSRFAPSLPIVAKRLDKADLLSLAGGIYETEGPPESHPAWRISARRIGPLPPGRSDPQMHGSWLAGLSRRAVLTLGRIQPELLVLSDTATSAKPHWSKMSLFEDHLSLPLENERAPIDLLVSLTEKQGFVPSEKPGIIDSSRSEKPVTSTDGEDGFQPEIAGQSPASAFKASASHAGILSASRLLPGEMLSFSASSGDTLELSMLNERGEKAAEYRNAQDEKAGSIPKGLQPAAFSRAANAGNLLQAANSSSQPEVDRLSASSLLPGETASFRAALRETMASLELSMLNEKSEKTAENRNAQDEKAGNIPASLQPTTFFRAVGAGNRQKAATKTPPPELETALMPYLPAEEIRQREKASDEDLDSLAGKIKRILDEEARRHGIDV